ncbi:Hint domain-containing protein [Tropicimonas sp. S265A]|uniref:Hint domain-containing protein n=1 Tax=Tropicimonas sp. S265A TaxID=3415134 RepID=UPI003C7B8DF4
MATYQIWALGASEVTVESDTNGDGTPDAVPSLEPNTTNLLSGGSQGAGTHLGSPSDGFDRYITLNSNAWQPIGINDDDVGFADNDSGQTLDVATTFDGTVYASGSRIESEYTLVLTDGTTDYTVVGFNIREPNPTSGNTYGTTEGLAFLGNFPPVGVPLRVKSASEGPSNAQTPAADYAVPPCYTPGTMIETPDGPRPVEDIRPGDLVLTRDDGAQEVTWAGSVALDSARLAGNPRFRPILIKAGALGPDQPACDMLVSRQHRILLRDWRAELMFGSSEVLVAAVDLVNDRDILQVYDLEPVTYIHFMFDRHQVVRADGLWAESLRPGPAVLATLGRAAQEELFALFPELRNADRAPFDAARPLLRTWEARVLTEPS